MTKDKKKSKKKDKQEKDIYRNSAPDWAKNATVEKEQPELEFKGFKW